MTEFKLPELGENIEQGDLVRLMVEPGTRVNEGQPVMELETDKAVVEVPSSVSGVIKEVRVKEGEKLKVGQVIFTVDDGAKRNGGNKKKEHPETPELRAATKDAGRATAETAAPSAQPLPPPDSHEEPRRASEFRLPELGENIEQGDLIRLMISPGTKVLEGQPVLELETDKAVVEVPCSVAGVVKDLHVKEGDKLKVGQLIFTLEGPTVAAPPQPKPEPVEHASGQHGARLAFQAAIQAEGKREEQALPPDLPFHPPPAFQLPAQLGKVAGTEHRPPIPAAPMVRRLARELGVDIYEVKATGPGRRISEDDVKAHAKQLLATAASRAQVPRSLAEPKLPDFAKWGKIERVSMRAVRRKTAEHLREAWNTVPHVTQNDRADITELEQLRARFATKVEEAGGKMTVTAIALKIAASALKIFPQFNASIDLERGEIVYKQYVNIGVAVDTERG
ncbi:MAG: 2-oxo acid dehydrogenase subunit E2, partial [Acidobacteria bacterium]|nr:2-oxo acid dehydrogenase subunit E2 [Acidobacteriota bacterium]